MTDQTTEVTDVTERHFVAKFRTTGIREEVSMILGDPNSPYILFIFQTCPDDPEALDIEVDTTGFTPDTLIEFLTEVTSKMKTSPAVERLPDGTVREFKPNRSDDV